MRPAYRHGNRYYTKSNAISLYWRGGPLDRLYGMPCCPTKKGAIEAVGYAWNKSVPKHCLTPEQKKLGIQPECDYSDLSTREPRHKVFLLPDYPFMGSIENYFSLDGYHYKPREGKLLKRSFREGEREYTLLQWITIAGKNLRLQYPLLKEKEELSRVCMACHFPYEQRHNHTTGGLEPDPRWNCQGVQDILRKACEVRYGG